MCIDMGQAVKDLAVALRGALSMKTADSFRAVYCWQTVRCLELWARVLAEHVHTVRLCCSDVFHDFRQLFLGAARKWPVSNMAWLECKPSWFHNAIEARLLWCGRSCGRWCTRWRRCCWARRGWCRPPATSPLRLRLVRLPRPDHVQAV